MSDIFTSNILHTVVQLQPSEFNDSRSNYFGQT